jgi:stage II sporulation protein AA (anti-sigma F factor antagonist)
MIEARVDVRSTGDHVRLVLSGDVDLSNATEVQAQLSSAIPNHAREVDLDLTHVTYLDSAGLQIVFSLTVQLRRLQIRLRIVAPPRSPAGHAIEMSGMASLAHIEPA